MLFAIKEKHHARPLIPHPPPMALWSFFLAALSRGPRLVVLGLLPSVGWGAVLFLALPALVPGAASLSLAPLVAPGSLAPLLRPLAFQWLCSLPAASVRQAGKSAP